MTSDVCSRLKINGESSTPKYKQIVNSIVEDIEKEYLIVGDKIPSISEISEEYLLSRDTVEKALNILKDRKIILSVKGKGYYVAKTIKQSKPKILLLLSKLCNCTLKIYNSFVASMGLDSQVELQLYGCDPEVLAKLLQENMDAYDYYVIMPHFKLSSNSDACKKAKALYYINQIPGDKLVLLDNHLPELGEDVASIYQDFETDIFQALKKGMNKLYKYEKLILVFPSNAIYPFPIGIKDGFEKFCRRYGFDFEIWDTVNPNLELEPKDAYVLVEESDLVNLMNQVNRTEYILGEDIGIISYHDTSLKDLLGITVVSTNFTAMGETAAFMIKKRKREIVKSVFHFIDRGSL